MASFIDHTGARQQVEVTLENTVRAAQAANMSVRDYFNATYTTDAEKYGDAFSQVCASEGLVFQPSKQYGIKSPSLDAVLNGRPSIDANAIVRTPSSQARVLTMPAIGDSIMPSLTATRTLSSPTRMLPSLTATQ